MLGRVVLFELRYQLRRPMALISFLTFATLAFAQVTNGISSGGGASLNAPLLTALNFSTFSVLGMFLSIATVADVALRDIDTRMDEIMRTQPVPTASYLASRFVGAYAVTCLTFLGVVLGIAAAAHMPWVAAGAVGPFRLESYAIALAVIAVPNLFVTGALFFTVATLTRSLLATYLSALALFVICIATRVLLSAANYQTLGALAD